MGVRGLGIASLEGFYLVGPDPQKKPTRERLGTSSPQGCRELQNFVHSNSCSEDSWLKGFAVWISELGIHTSLSTQQSMLQTMLCLTDSLQGLPKKGLNPTLGV